MSSISTSISASTSISIHPHQHPYHITISTYQPHTCDFPFQLYIVMGFLVKEKPLDVGVVVPVDVVVDVVDDDVGNILVCREWMGDVICEDMED